MNDTIEGIDYIFDRYQYLGLSYDASQEEIKKSIRIKRVENHPDKLLRVSQDILNLSKKTLELVDVCERVLTNLDIKELYDGKLQNFIQKEPHLVSTSGIPLISLDRVKVNVDYLLGEQISDFSDLEEKVSQMSGYQSKRLDKAFQRYEKEPSIDNREMLREQLTNKLIYLNLMEDFYWQKAGIHGFAKNEELHRVQSTTDIIEQFEHKLKKVNDMVEQHVGDRNGVALLGFVPPLLLGDSTEKYDAKENHFALTQAAIKNFELRAEDLKKLMAEKKKH